MTADRNERIVYTLNAVRTHDNAPTSARNENRPMTRREPRTQTAGLLRRIAAACIHTHPKKGNDTDEDTP